ncbi:hypothetical protein [Bradyrhizobium japonicum]|uniref:hypothetical protein n=1 Tax=Bradyrhizobium japonicum TaxID=375 RepID=UPI001B8A6442|nr:hypothetical protein [Bradyrhizobium japonicum]MBR0969622.1 hypothetical protein [Bradyrhizobium japonicum]
MLASPSKPSNTITRGGAAKGRAPDENIHLLVAKVSQICSELDTDKSNHLSDVGAEKIAIELDRLEKKIVNAQASTIEGLRAKAEAADKLCFEYGKIPDSIVRDIMTNKFPGAT